jgi:hypothetical protein
MGTMSGGERADEGSDISAVEREVDKYGDAVSCSGTSMSRVARSMSWLVQLPRWMGMGAEAVGAAASASAGANDDTRTA